MRSNTVFACQKCGHTYSKWVGQCSDCGAWNSLVEQVPEVRADAKSALAKGKASGKKLDFVKISSIVPSDAKARLVTEFTDLNTVLGVQILILVNY